MLNVTDITDRKTNFISALCKKKKVERKIYKDCKFLIIRLYKRILIEQAAIRFVEKNSNIRRE